MSFQKRLIKMRSKLNLTQLELANAISVTRAAVNGWENNPDLRAKPTYRNLDKLASTLGVTAEWLENGDTVSTFKPKDYISTTQHNLLFSSPPFLNQDEIGDWIKSKKHILKKGDKMTELERQSTQYEIKIEGDAMYLLNNERSLKSGDIVRIDPTLDNLKAGDFVLAKGKGMESYKVRMFCKDGSEEYLSALNPLFPNISLYEVDANIIVGKLTKKITDL